MEKKIGNMRRPMSKEVETERNNQVKSLVIEVNSAFEGLINKFNTTK